ncbi:sugar transferase [Parasphingorhabdus halotolerans]|uniref:Sugar transferase n=1 Tax=Parasphingorhabdus halotolerans TaxID=2725558 RepID=A0A6H2DP68_9SPHN|nr:sugar transferase [Parasphingorhabdus halotolerans]QJB69755.1 sugar transferase [Parasphingorhabdus halotolerans]
MKRLIDMLLLAAALPFVLPLSVVVAFAVKLTSKGPALYWSKRSGKNDIIFLMPKFRTMRIDTPTVATHLLDEPGRWLTSVGPFLRRTSLDEIPQLFCLLTGEMTMVGPRPALFNQDDLISLRRERGINVLTPGITGWAQINGRDDLPIPTKVEFESEYMNRRSPWLDLKIIILTFWKVVRPSNVSH